MRQSVTEAGGALTRECGTMPCPALDPHGEGPQEAQLVAHQRSWPPTTPWLFTLTPRFHMLHMFAPCTGDPHGDFLGHQRG